MGFPLPYVLSPVVNADVSASAAIDISKIAAPWTSYTPAWTSETGTDPAIGSGTLSGSYVQVGKVAIVQVLMVAAADTTFGTGLWRFSVPVDLANVLTTPYQASVVCKNTGVQWYAGLAGPASASTIEAVLFGASSQLGATVDATNPFTWGDADEIDILYVYESV